MKKKILDEECDKPIVISISGNLVSDVDSEDPEKIKIGSGWHIIITGLDEGELSDEFPFHPGDYDRTALRKACVFCLLNRIVNPSPASAEPQEDSDKYIVYEIIANTSKKTISFEVEVLDENNEIEFIPDNDNLKNLIDYEGNGTEQIEE